MVCRLRSFLLAGLWFFCEAASALVLTGADTDSGKGRLHGPMYDKQRFIPLTQINRATLWRLSLVDWSRGLFIDAKGRIWMAWGIDLQ